MGIYIRNWIERLYVCTWSVQCIACSLELGPALFISAKKTYKFLLLIHETVETSLSQTRNLRKNLFKSCIYAGTVLKQDEGA